MDRQLARAPLGDSTVLYLAIGLLSVLFVALGFWPSYFGPLFAGTADTVPILHFHATVFVGWLLLFIAQAYFAATRRVKTHIRLGKLGIAYGTVVIVVGLATGLTMFALRMESGDVAQANRALYNAVLDMAVFTPFFAAAILLRRRPEWHKRLMLLAATSLLVAAVFRMSFLGTPRNLWLAHAIWYSPVVLAMSYDFLRQRLVHPIYCVGLIVLMGQSPIFRGLVASSDAWNGFCAWLGNTLS